MKKGFLVNPQIHTSKELPITIPWSPAASNEGDDSASLLGLTFAPILSLPGFARCTPSLRPVQGSTTDATNENDENGEKGHITEVSCLRFVKVSKSRFTIVRIFYSTFSVKCKKKLKYFKAEVLDSSNTGVIRHQIGLQSRHISASYRTLGVE